MSTARLIGTVGSKVVQRVSEYGYQTAHYAAKLGTVGVTAAEVLGSTAAAGVSQALPGVALAMGAFGLALGVSDFFASYAFSSVRIAEPSEAQQKVRLSELLKETDSSKLSGRVVFASGDDAAHLTKEEIERMKVENLRRHGMFVALSSLPVTGLSILALTPSHIPAVLSGFSAGALPFLGLAITTGMQFFAEGKALLDADEPLKPSELLSVLSKGLATAGWAMVALGNPALGLAFLGASFYGQYRAGTLVNDTFANLSAIPGVNRISFCRPSSPSRAGVEGEADLSKPSELQASYRPSLVR